MKKGLQMPHTELVVYQRYLFVLTCQFFRYPLPYPFSLYICTWYPYLVLWILDY